MTAYYYVARDDALAIKALYSQPQDGIPEELLIDEDTEVMAFLAAQAAEADKDPQRTFNLQVAMELADLKNAGSFLGESGDYFSDSFETTTYIDLVNSVNIDTSSGTHVEPTHATPPLIPQATGTAFGNMTAGGGLAAAFDGTTSQTIAASAQNAGSTGYLGKDFSASPKDIFKAVVYPSNDRGFDNNVPATNITLELYAKIGATPSGPTDGTRIGSRGPFADSLSSAEVTSTDHDTVWDHVWVVITSTGSTVAIAECQFYESGAANDMTLISTAFTAYDGAPSQAKMALVVQCVDGGTVEDNLTVEFSRNNGTNYSWATLSTLYPIPNGSNLYMAETNHVDLTAQPTGTQVRYRIVSYNQETTRVLAQSTYWR